MFTKVLIGLGIVLVIFLVVVALQPADFRIARSATVSAPPAVVFAQVNDFHRWEAWNPWGRIDPAMKQSYDGAPAGTGAIYSWVGNNEVGEGRMTLIESRPPELIRIKLEFFKPMAATNTAEFTFQPEGERTVVTWSMTGKNGFIAKAFCLFVSMDRMVGGQFEKGLADLKSVSETAASK